MQISKSSIWVWLIKLNYRISNERAYDRKDHWGDTIKGKVKGNLCGFFWQTVGAIFLSLVNIPGVIIALCSSKRDNPGESDISSPGLWFIIQGLSAIIGCGILFQKLEYQPSFLLVLLSMLMGFIAIIIACFAAIGIIYVVEKSKAKIEDRKYEKRKAKRNKNTENVKPSFLKLTGQFFKARKQKLCPRIEFIDDVKN